MTGAPPSRVSSSRGRRDGHVVGGDGTGHVDHEVGGRAGVEAERAVGGHGHHGGVGDDLAGTEVEVRRQGQGGAAGVGGHVAGRTRPAGDGEVHDGCLRAGGHDRHGDIGDESAGRAGVERPARRLGLQAGVEGEPPVDVDDDVGGVDTGGDADRAVRGDGHDGVVGHPRLPTGVVQARGLRRAVDIYPRSTEIVSAMDHFSPGEAYGAASRRWRRSQSSTPASRKGKRCSKPGCGTGSLAFALVEARRFGPETPTVLTSRASAGNSPLARRVRPTQMGTTRLLSRFRLGAIAPCGEMRQAVAPLTRVCRTGMADRAKGKMTLARSHMYKAPPR